MKALLTTILLIKAGYYFVAAEESPTPVYPQSMYGNLKEETSAPPGLITVIRENKSWRFKIAAGSSGWNQFSSLDKAILRGKGFSVPINANVFPSVDGKSFVNITLTDDMVKTADLELWYSYTGRGGNRATRYTIKLSELTK